MIEIPQKPEDALPALASLSRFGVLSEMRGMREWLKSELARLDKLNRHEIDRTVLRQRQGACQVLEKIFELADTSDETASKIRANVAKGKGV